MFISWQTGLYPISKVTLTIGGTTRQASEFGGHLRGKLIFFGGGGRDIIFKKVLLFAHAFVTGLSPPPPPEDSPPSQKGGEYPRNIAPL